MMCSVAERCLSYILSVIAAAFSQALYDWVINRFTPCAYRHRCFRLKRHDQMQRLDQPRHDPHGRMVAPNYLQRLSGKDRRNFHEQLVAVGECLLEGGKQLFVLLGEG